MRAYMMLDRAAKAGFDWNRACGHLNKVEQIFSELKSALSGDEKNETVRALGDLLLVLVNFARTIDYHPETALRGSLKRFERRFKVLEKRIAESGRELERVAQDEKDLIWEKANTISR